MKLRKKTLIIICVTIVSLIAILYCTSQIIFLNSFVRLEEQNTRQNVERVQSALSADLISMDLLVHDWAAWDDTYDFIQDRNEDYIESNLPDETFPAIEMNFMLFANSSGGIMFSKFFDLENEEEIPVPESLLEHLSPNSVLLQHFDIESSITGIILLPEDPLLIASRPIVTSEKKGPILGTLIMGYYLDSGQIAGLAETTHLSIHMLRLDDSQMPADFQTALSSLSGDGSIFVEPLDVESIAGYTLLKDVYGEPILVLRVDMPRDIFKQGQGSIAYFMLWLVAAGLVFGSVTVLLLEKVVLQRLSQLNKNVSGIGTSSDLSTRLSMAGNDELSSLADAINDMLAALEHSQDELQENQRKFEQLFRDNPEAAVYLGSDFKILDINPRFTEVFGYSLDEIRGKHIDNTVVPKDKMEEAKMLDEKAKEGYVYHDTVRKRKDGSSVPVSISAASITIGDKLIGYVGVYKDISQLKRTENDLKETLEKLKVMNEKLHVIGRLARHDVGNKLSTVTGNTFLARRRLTDDHECLNYLEEIESAVQQVEGIFDFARTYEKLGIEELAYMDVEKNLEQAVKQFSDLHNIKIANDCRGLTVLADSLLTRLFYNLIDNSLKYGERVSQIRVYYEEAGKDKLKLVYEDNGVGIPKAEKEKVFKEGYGKGTGYGLYIIRKMCEVYGWTIKETGKPGKGVQFTITIPKVDESGKDRLLTLSAPDIIEAKMQKM